MKRSGVQGKRRHQTPWWALAVALVGLWALTCKMGWAPDGWPHAHHLALPLDLLVHAATVQIALAVAVVAAGVWWALWYGTANQRALRASRCGPSAALQAAALGLVPPDRLYLLQETQCYAACIGYWRPAIYVTTGLLKCLSGEALRAALAHEEAHRRHHDPMRLLVLRILTRGVAAVPWIAAAPARIELHFEIAADRFARSQTSTAALAGALLSVLRSDSDGSLTSGTLGQQRDGPFAVNHLVGPTAESGERWYLDERLRYLEHPLTTPLPSLIAPDISKVQLTLGLLIGFRWPLLAALALSLMSSSPLVHWLGQAAACATHL